jgi:hypothetical protein
VAKDSVPVVVIYPHTVLCHSKMNPTKTMWIRYPKTSRNKTGNYSKRNMVWNRRWSPIKCDTVKIVSKSFHRMLEQLNEISCMLRFS